MIKSNTWPGCSGPCCSSVVLYRPRAHFNINTKCHPTWTQGCRKSRQGLHYHTELPSVPVPLWILSVLVGGMWGRGAFLLNARTCHFLLASPSWSREPRDCLKASWKLRGSSEVESRAEGGDVKLRQQRTPRWYGSVPCVSRHLGSPSSQSSSSAVPKS